MGEFEMLLELALQDSLANLAPRHRGKAYASESAPRGSLVMLNPELDSGTHCAFCFDWYSRAQRSKPAQPFRDP
jgi:hypothetical protein